MNLVSSDRYLTIDDWMPNDTEIWREMAGFKPATPHAQGSGMQFPVFETTGWSTLATMTQTCRAATSLPGAP